LDSKWLSRIFDQVLPTWSRQTDYARLHAQTSVNDLVSRFLSIIRSLQEIVSDLRSPAGDDGSDNNVLKVFHESQEELNKAVALLAADNCNKEEALAMIAGVSKRMNETAGTFAVSVAKFEQNSFLIQQHIDECIVSLQFEDRINQVLHLVASKQNELSKEMEKMLVARAGDADFDVDVWIDSIEKSYNMEEQRLDPKRNTVADKSHAEDDVTFF